MSEPVRLVIWDLDEVFWKGTLTEGGIRYVPENQEIIVKLARRGIMSSICSKNNLDDVRSILEERGVWSYFIFPSVSWEPKGPRLAKLIESAQLRPQTILFIDDNAGNRNEALHFNPGLQVSDETIVPTLLESPLLKGKDDASLTRLAQYKILEQRNVAQSESHDNISFLRQSNIQVSIEYDVEKYVDRAVELINRTNQLNFTQLRLPEDPDAARTELLSFLGQENTQAGLVRVRDKYGDYGFTGFYAMQVHTWWAHHFCFSCRTLGMGVEAWLHERLGKPKLVCASGGAAKAPLAPHTPIDWINQHQQASDQSTNQQVRVANRIIVRGGCDAQSIMHYLAPVTDEVIGEFPFNRAGRMIATNHSIFLEYALSGISAEQLRAAEALGHEASDFTSKLADGADAFDACVLSFWADCHYALYRHKTHGIRLPFPLHHFNCGLDVRQLSDDEIHKHFPTTEDRRPFDNLVTSFEFEPVSMSNFEHSARSIFKSIPVSKPIFVLQGLETMQQKDGKHTTLHHIASLNRATESAADGLPNVHLLAIDKFIECEDDVIDGSHFDRLVYFRVFQEISSILRSIEPSRNHA